MGGSVAELLLRPWVLNHSTPAGLQVTGPTVGGPPVVSSGPAIVSGMPDQLRDRKGVTRHATRPCWTLMHQLVQACNFQGLTEMCLPLFTPLQHRLPILLLRCAQCRSQSSGGEEFGTSASRCSTS